MAEEKKEVASDEWLGRAFEAVFIIILLISLFNWAAPRVQNFVGEGFSGIGGGDSVSIPPQNESQENRLLGALISGRTNTSEAFSKLNETMFQNPKNKAVFRAAKSLFDDGIPINLNTLTARLSEQGQLANIGGRPYLESLIASVDSGRGSVYQFFQTAGHVVRTILLWIALFSIVGIAYVTGKLIFLEREQAATYIDVAPEVSASKADNVWRRLLELAQSNNPSDRKIAIIEADALLEDMVSHMGYSGDSLGEKLKGIERTDFRTLQYAWEAHKFRNEIAHAGKEVTKRDAQYVMMLYEKVFQEFEYL